MWMMVPTGCGHYSYGYSHLGFCHPKVLQIYRQLMHMVMLVITDRFRRSCCRVADDERLAANTTITRI